MTDVVGCAAARIRAIALEVCSSVAGHYHVVRITSRADLPALQAMMCVEGLRTLAWLDLDDEGQCDEELLDALRPLLSAAVHVLLTSSAASAASEASAAQLRALAAALAPDPSAAATSFVKVSLARRLPRSSSDCLPHEVIASLIK
jgi:hypothetical protein